MSIFNIADEIKKAQNNLPSTYGPAIAAVGLNLTPIWVWHKAELMRRDGKSEEEVEKFVDEATKELRNYLIGIL